MNNFHQTIMKYFTAFGIRGDLLFHDVGKRRRCTEVTTKVSQQTQGRTFEHACGLLQQ